MNTLDLAILIPVTLGFIFGLFKGFIKELSSLAAIVLGIFGAKIFAPSLSSLLITKFDFSTKTSTPFAYFILFVAIAIILLFVAKALERFFDSFSLGGINKLLGGIFSALKYALIVSVLLNVFDALDSKISLIKNNTKTESVCYKPALGFAPELWDKTKDSKAFPFKADEKTHQ